MWLIIACMYVSPFISFVWPALYVPEYDANDSKRHNNQYNQYYYTGNQYRYN